MTQMTKKISITRQQYKQLSELVYQTSGIVLNEKKYQIEIDPDISNKAVSALNEMIKYI